jgi:proteasome assembly chaperone (PAC2) family protein
MGRIAKGLAAGAVATAVLSMLMAMKTAIHVMIGVVGYGLFIALLDTRLPGRSATLHGVLIGFAGWLLMMTMLMPMAGAGLFGMALGMMAPMMTLVLHLIFGAALGWMFGRLNRSSVVQATA